MKDIRIIIVGGTIDKVYDPSDGNAKFKGELEFDHSLPNTYSDSHINLLLEEAWCTQPTIEYEVINLIDSLKMTDEDRTAVFEACQRSEQKKIIVTHGTDTMVERILVNGEIKTDCTARKLEGLTDRTIVLVGAMIPWTFCKSDAPFNVGMAMAAVQLLAPGVYVTMSGGVSPSTNVRKNIRDLEFIPKNAPVKLTAPAKLE